MKKITTDIKSPADFTEKFINQTNQSVFLTGKAGTGKTTLLKKIISSTHKNTVVVAPTGIAALNAGGVTIHSFFMMPFGAFIPVTGQPPSTGRYGQFNTKDTLFKQGRLNKQRIEMFRKLELLIIDEVSMLRADLLDAMDYKLRKIRRNNNPFGGVQVLFIGDLLQLPPIVKDDERRVLDKYYDGYFFFHAQVTQEQPPLYIELDKIYRQSDETFIELLNELRNNFISDKYVKLLNQYVKPGFDATKHEGYITLTTHNRVADEMNERALKAIPGRSYVYTAKVEKDFPENIYPIPQEMELKVGAQVMFIKNDLAFEKRYYNGKIGVISELTADKAFVTFPEEGVTINVEQYEWENKKFSLDEKTGEIKEEVIGVFSHFPLKLAWAITIHKSQGLTFEKAVLDLSRVFAPGQAYVGLSRLVSLNGLILKSPIQLNGLQNDAHVINYARNKADEEVLSSSLKEATATYLRDRLQQTFNWESMASKWLVLEADHKSAGARSEMAKNREGFVNHVSILMSTLEPAAKFRAQLNKICRQTPLNIELLQQRYEAAYDYFIKKLEPVFRGNIKRILLLGQKRTVKQYTESLMELDELITEVIGDLKRTRNLIDKLYKGEELNKSTIWDDQVRNFKEAKVELIKQEIKNKHPEIWDNADFVSFEKKPTKTASKKGKSTQKKRVKGATFNETLALFKAGKNATQIAEERGLAESTIVGHYARLVQDKRLNVEEVLSEEKLNLFKTKFVDGLPESFSKAKEILGDDATYQEMKVYLASIEQE